jgi:hypothetical protein
MGDEIMANSKVLDIIMACGLFIAGICFIFIGLTNNEEKMKIAKLDSYACGYLDGSIATAKTLVSKRNARYWLSQDYSEPIINTNNTCNH